MRYPLLGALLAPSLLLCGLLPGAAMAEEQAVRGSYLLDSKPVGQTPKYLGVCLEVADNAKPVNVLVKNMAEVPADQWVQIEQTLPIPVDASRIQVELAFAGAPKQAGTLYVDDINLSGN